MRESCTYGSVRGALSNERPYRDVRSFVAAQFEGHREDRFGSFSTVLPTCRKSIHVGCSPDSGGAVHGRLFVGQCHNRP